jgi:hypothetical protein
MSLGDICPFPRTKRVIDPPIPLDGQEYGECEMIEGWSEAGPPMERKGSPRAQEGRGDRHGSDGERPTRCLWVRSPALEASSIIVV